MTLPKIRPILLGLTSVIVLLSLLIPEIIQILDVGSFVTIMAIVGIPHGSIDHVIYRHFQHDNSRETIQWWKFYSIYIISLVVFGISWFVIPLLSLISFVIISAYHFGQAHLFAILRSKSHPLQYLGYSAWGITVIFGLLSFQFREIVGSFEMSQLFPSINSWQPIVFTIHIFSLLVTICLIMGLTLTKSISARRGIIEAVVLVLLHGLYLVAPPLTSFAIFFGLWHSLPVMIQEYSELRQKNSSINVRNFIIKLIPYSVISFIGIAGLIGFAGYWKDLISPFMLFFIGLSALTFPHVFYMARFYLSLSKINKDSTHIQIGEWVRKKTA